MAAVDFRKVSQSALVKHTDMPHELSADAQEVIMGAIDKYFTAENFEKAAQAIKETMDKRHGATWHCVIGEGFGFEITHETRNLIYMQYMEKLGIVLYKC